VEISICARIIDDMPSPPARQTGKKETKKKTTKKPSRDHHQPYG
jgi:hypothetical protein